MPNIKSNVPLSCDIVIECQCNTYTIRTCNQSISMKNIDKCSFVVLKLLIFKSFFQFFKLSNLEINLLSSQIQVLKWHIFNKNFFRKEKRIKKQQHNFFNLGFLDSNLSQRKNIQKLSLGTFK